ncbi:hypothetical protein VE04_00034 [Pseudogymnoascus sp. 24MN13]|nr:hypothetical protein VE04_00034 [Pseudogymnoascus sp. 24MN13]
MAAQQKQEHRNLVKEYNIFFDGPIDRAQWPTAHCQTFSNIQKLGRTGFAEYRESVTVDSEDKPWREQTKSRAERIAALARICREGRKNEAGWRMSLESEILARFTIEVACRKCRARLWRSELEVEKASLEPFSESLEERQRKRVPCMCRRGKRGVDAMEQGVSLLFDDRAQEAILHEAALQAAMQKKEEQPDRVYGLRKTNRLERLLCWTEDKRVEAGGKMIGESVQSTPFRPDGEPIVFPFLALEAKSEKGRDAFSDIETQTAFTIRSLLTLQENLRRAAGEDSEWESGPLVWFLANKGEQWRVAAAYIDYKSGIRNHRIIDLWDGRIVSSDGALQLLLIVDYIFDWARDSYRETIISELRSLAMDNTSSLGNDSDIFSLQDRVAFWPQFPPAQESRDDEEENPSQPNASTTTTTQDRLKKFDSPNGVLRDTSFIRSRCMALHITKDNFSLLMKSMQTADKARKAAENILRCLKDAWRINNEALDKIELAWTGADRENTSWYGLEKVFLVTMTLSAYISPDWEQTRELCYLAVSEGVVEELFQHAKLKSNQRWLSSDFPWVGEEEFVSFFSSYLEMSAEDNLLAAISRSSVSTKLFTGKTDRTTTKTDDCAETNTWWVPSVEKLPGRTKYRFDAAILPDSQAHTRGFVSSIYNLYKIGRNEPSSSILRISNRIDHKQRREGALESMWPSLSPAISSSYQGQDTIFVSSKSPSNVPQYAELCLFLMNASRTIDLVDWDKLEQSNTTCNFQAMRVDTKPGWGGGWNRGDLQNHDQDFLDNKRRLLNYLKALGGFKEYKKGKAVEQPALTKTWKAKKNYSHFTLATTEPQSFEKILQFRDTMSQRGRRLTAVTALDRSFSQAELCGIARIQDPGASATIAATALSDPPPTLGSGPDSLSTQLDGSLGPKGFDLEIDSPEIQQEYMNGPNNSLSASLRSKGKAAANNASGRLGPYGSSESAMPDREGSLKVVPTLQLRGHGSKRPFGSSDQGMSSSSAGPSKRARRESQSTFDCDYLNDEELCALLENGGFAE